MYYTVTVTVDGVDQLARGMQTPRLGAVSAAYLVECQDHVTLLRPLLELCHHLIILSWQQHMVRCAGLPRRSGLADGINAAAVCCIQWRQAFQPLHDKQAHLQESNQNNDTMGQLTAVMQPHGRMQCFPFQDNHGCLCWKELQSGHARLPASRISSNLTLFSSRATFLSAVNVCCAAVRAATSSADPDCCAACSSCGTSTWSAVPWQSSNQAPPADQHASHPHTICHAIVNGCWIDSECGLCWAATVQRHDESHAPSHGQPLTQFQFTAPPFHPVQCLQHNSHRLRET